jgi:hypothetical protein
MREAVSGRRDELKERAEKVRTSSGAVGVANNSEVTKVDR